MTRRLLQAAAFGACVAAACLTGPAPARAGFPFTDESWVDPCIVTCPYGDSSFTVFARRNGHWSGDPVWVDFCNCPDLVFAPLDGSEPYVMGGCTAMRSSPEFGTTLFEFPFKAGGVCNGATITIYLFIPDNFIRASVASFDQNGDLAVDAADVAIVTGKIGTADPTADFDCDGQVTEADREIQLQHFNHRWSVQTTGVGGSPMPELTLALRKNPTRGDLNVDLTLPYAAPARLELHDLAGRWIEAREVGALGPGSHVVTLAQGRTLAPGVYVLRLTQGARSRTARAVVLR